MSLAPRLLLVALALLFLVLQFRLWVGEGSVAQTVSLSSRVEQQRQKNSELQQRRERLSGEVDALKNGLEEIESRAREELGLVKPGEIFYTVVEEPVP